MSGGVVNVHLLGAGDSRLPTQEQVWPDSERKKPTMMTNYLFAGLLDRQLSAANAPELNRPKCWSRTKLQPVETETKTQT
jgi:hypothetical protein